MAWGWAYLAALVVMGVLDALWLGYLARDFYQRELADLAAPAVRKLPAAVFYLAYPAGLLALALSPAPQSLPSVLGSAALVGLVAYGAYDLTNMATLRHWSLKLVLVDVGWGVFASALAGAAAHWAWQRG